MPPPQPHSEVPKIELNDTDGTITLTVQVYGFDARAPVEISGHATQANGAVTTFYDVQEMPAPDADGGSVLNVTGVPSTAFQKGEPITVVARAAEVWFTELNPDPSPATTASVNATWTKVDYHYAVLPRG
jgi:hypothetical protein